MIAPDARERCNRDGWPAIGGTHFFDWIENDVKRPGGNMETCSGVRVPLEGAETDMIRRVALAWTTPFDELSCEQVRLLAGQRMGLEWLGAPLCSFVSRFPTVMVTYFPGDLTTNAFRIWRELTQSAPDAAAQMLTGSFEWLDTPDMSKTLATELQTLLMQARASLSATLKGSKPVR